MNNSGGVFNSKVSYVSRLVFDLMKPNSDDFKDFDEESSREDATEAEDNPNRINYGLNIKTKRLWNGKLEYLGDEEEDE